MRLNDITVERAKKGDVNAFSELVSLNQGKVYSLALKLLSNEQDALDAAQESFIKAWTSLSTFRGESSFSVWLYRLTYNTCMDALRRRKNEKSVSLTYEDDAGEEKTLPVCDTTLTPDEHVLKKERRDKVRDAIKLLSDEHRQILTLREFGDMSYSDIAAALDISEGTVKSRICRARRALYEILKNDGTFSDDLRQNIGKGDV